MSTKQLLSTFLAILVFGGKFLSGCQAIASEPDQGENVLSPISESPTPPDSAPRQDDRLKDREIMVQTQIQNRGVEDPLVLAAMKMVQRHEFVPEQYLSQAYADHPLPIGYGQTISQPYIVALMTEVLQLKPGNRVLEIGTGSGYQAAVLAEMDTLVYTVEIIPELASQALKDIADGAPKTSRITPDLIIEAVVNSFQLTPADLKGRKRDEATALARQVTMYLIRQETDYSLAEIGRELGGRSPATISHAYQKIASVLNNSPSLRHKVFDIQQRVYASTRNGDVE